MPGKRGSSSKHDANTTGKPGNASGSKRREARGDPASRSGGRKHPAPKIFTAPQTEKKRLSAKRAAYTNRQSNRGGAKGR